MSAQTCRLQCEDDFFLWDLIEATVLSPENQFYENFRHITHTSLQVCDDAPESPLPDNIPVQVFDPSKNIKIPFILKSTDTVGTLVNEYLKMRPELDRGLRLAYNGKRVSFKKSMRELGVKPGAMFITFRRCVGG